MEGHLQELQSLNNKLMQKHNLRTSFKAFKKETKSLLSLSTYLKIAQEYIKFLITNVLEGHTVHLPSKLGCLSILGKEQKIKRDEDGNLVGLAPDWVSTKKLWDKDPEKKKEKRLIYFLNLETDSVRYKYFWSKNRVLVENKTLYSLRLTRTNKRLAHKEIINGTQFKIL